MNPTMEKKNQQKENKRTTNNKNKTMEKSGVEGGGRKNSHIIFKKVC